MAEGGDLRGGQRINDNGKKEHGYSRFTVGSNVLISLKKNKSEKRKRNAKEKTAGGVQVQK